MSPFNHANVIEESVQKYLLSILISNESSTLLINCASKTAAHNSRRGKANEKI